MANVSATERAHATLTSTTADTVTLTKSCQFVDVTNHHASVVLYVTVSKSPKSSALVPTPTTAVAAAAGTFSISPGRTKRVMNSPGRATFVKLSVVGNANPYSVEGTNVR